ncbi:hypothetical protein AB0I10_40800 [Streptomyces sp. NPDC050636]|uniref:hypothetical protein n=1 Tax=Streptomyces sp. NPDC050636 TaxID=3154510 RepID=UPI00344927EF
MSCSTIDEQGSFARRVTHLRNYLDAYRQGDLVYPSGRLVHIKGPIRSPFGVELTLWPAAASFSPT